MKKTNYILFAFIGLIVISGLVTATLAIDSKTNQAEINDYLTKNVTTIPVGFNSLERHASFPEKPNFEILKNNSVVIASGKVTKIGKAYLDELGLAYHNITIETDKIYKYNENSTEANTLTFKVFGGEIGNDIYWAKDAPRFSKNEKVLVFLGQGQQDLFVTYEIYGKFSFQDNKIVGINPDFGLIEKSLTEFEKITQI